MAPHDALIPDIDIWKTSGMIIPAIMTLICFICTAVSLTVSGFICLRDREAQDEIDNKARHHKQQEFISKALGMSYVSYFIVKRNLYDYISISLQECLRKTLPNEH